MVGYMKLPALLGPGGTDVAGSMKKLQDLLRKTGEKGSVVIRVLSATGQANDYVVKPPVRRGRARTGEPRADLLLTISQANWLAVARGQKSPLTMFLDGNLGVAGSIHLGTRLLSKIGLPAKGRFTICREE